MVPRVKTRFEPVQPGTGGMPEDASSTQAVSIHGAPALEVEKATFDAHIVQIEWHEQGEEETGGHYQGGGAQSVGGEAPVAAYRQTVDVKCHRLVLGFFQGVPGPEGLVARVRSFQNFRQTEQAVGEDRGEVFQRYGGGQLERVRRGFLYPFQQVGNEAFLGFNGHTGSGDVFVVVFVLASMHGFLANKASDCRFQRLVLDEMTILTHAVDKEALPDGEEQAQRVEELADIQAVAVPVHGVVRIKFEVQIAASRKNVDRHNQLPLMNVTLFDDTVDHAFIKWFFRKELAAVTDDKHKKASRLLEALIVHVHETLGASTLDRWMIEELDYLLELAGTVRLNEAVNPEQISITARKYAVQMELGGGVPELVGEMVERLYHHSIQDERLIGDVIDEATVTALLDKGLEIPLSRRGIGWLSRNPVLLALLAGGAQLGMKTWVHQGVPESVRSLVGQRVPARWRASLELRLQEWLLEQIGRAHV